MRESILEAEKRAILGLFGISGKDLIYFDLEMNTKSSNIIIKCKYKSGFESYILDYYEIQDKDKSNIYYLRHKILAIFEISIFIYKFNLSFNMSNDLINIKCDDLTYLGKSKIVKLNKLEKELEKYNMVKV